MKIALSTLQARHPAAAPAAAPVLRVEQLEVRAGEQLAVIGPSGAGTQPISGGDAASLVDAFVKRAEQVYG